MAGSDSAAPLASLRSRLDDGPVGLRTLLIVALVLNAELLFVVLYAAFSNATITAPRYILYGLTWVNVGALVLWRVRPPAGYDFETRRRALAVAAGYFALLAFFGGMVGIGVPPDFVDLRIAWLPPGWGPALVWATEYLTIVVMPAYLVGYTALAYLLYITALEASGSVVAGVVGLFSCVSCTLPIVAALVSSFLGGTGIVAATALDASYGASTAVFLVTVALLYWRPGFR
ncbi:DUF7546 family protein [Haloparvum sedimenti]|nr:hypothetical protein [Haloparvum sedimenti]